MEQCTWQWSLAPCLAMPRWDLRRLLVDLSRGSVYYKALPSPRGFVSRGTWWVCRWSLNLVTCIILFFTLRELARRSKMEC